MMEMMRFIELLCFSVVVPPANNNIPMGRHPFLTFPTLYLAHSLTFRTVMFTPPASHVAINSATCGEATRYYTS